MNPTARAVVAVWGSDSLHSDQSDPSDLASLCGPQSGKLQTLITKKCDDTAQVAMQAYSSICSSAGHKVGMYNVDLYQLLSRTHLHGMVSY